MGVFHSRFLWSVTSNRVLERARKIPLLDQVMVLRQCLNFFRAQQSPLQPQHHRHSLSVFPLWTLTGDSQYFKLGGGVLYHLSSGRICHNLGQDPSHSDDDVTVYAAKTSVTHGIFIRRSITSTSGLLPSGLPLSILLPSKPDRPQTKQTFG